MSQRTFAGVTLTDDEQKICRDMGIEPDARFATLLAARRAGQPLVMSSRQMKENHKNGIIGPQVAAEAFEEHRDELENESANSRTLAQEASKSIGEFLAKPDAPDAWKILARATAMLMGALDRIAPPFADRVADTKEKESQWK